MISPNITTCRLDKKVSCVDPVGIAICSQARKAFYPEQGSIPQPFQLASQLLYQLSYPVDSLVYGLFLYITVKSLATYMCIITTLITDQIDYEIKETLMINKRAQRALGRSPEDKVKGQGKAIYRDH